MQAERPSVRDPYEVLSLHPLAPKDLVEEAYWELVGHARALPIGIAGARIAQLTAAYEMLATEAHREAYDGRSQGGSVSAGGGLQVRGSVGSRRSREGTPKYGDYYELLRVHANADPGVIEIAVRIMSYRYGGSSENGQPDRETFEDARRTLLTPELRTAYDERRRSAGAFQYPAVRPGHRSEHRTVATLETHPSATAANTVAAADRPPAPPTAGRAPAHLDVTVPLPLTGTPHTTLDDDVSARRVLTGEQKLVGIALLTLTLIGLVLATNATLILLISSAAAVYLVSICCKAYLAATSLSDPRDVHSEPDDIASIPDEALPVYTVILPLYREEKVLGALMRAIEGLDYPKQKLDVKLLLEHDDTVTRAAVNAMDLPGYIEVLSVPDVGPQGKPRACNYGLAGARGAYLVLYDAEDRPQPDQLKKALLAFSNGGPDVACVQAKLDFYNPDQNLLTKWFTIEYSTWFQLYLPALNGLGVPIPLGGTSNHFRVDQLRSVGAWDPYNVTEDADLGIRLARRDFKTLVIDSVTYEEANSRLGNWLRQRSRWVKGYMQTWLVHMRHPLRLYSELGAVGFLAFQVMVLGTFAAYLINPVFWGLLVVWYATQAADIRAIYPAPLLYISAATFFGGNFLFIFTAVAASLQRGFYHGVKYALINHFYWALMSVASWKALIQLVTKPHYWEKTEHGLDAPTTRQEVGRPL